MERNTDMGGPAASFPATHCSLVRAAASLDLTIRKQALEVLIAAYWKPVYKYIRLHFHASNEDAKDYTQAFFAAALEKGLLERFDPARGRFRTFVRVCVDRFVANERRAASRLKRGGEHTILSLDFQQADQELMHQAIAPGTDPEELFHKEWARSLVALAVEDLSRHCATSDRATHFAVFERYDLEGPEASPGLTYADLARELGLSESQITNYLAYARGRFRELLLERVRSATGSDEEYHEEVYRLFGRDLA
jgi:RNA polymerase sigma factor (sigma-70 family)